LRALSIQWLAMRATIKGLVVHGKEHTGTEPLLTAEEVQAGLRIDSFWGRRISLDELVLQKPHVHIRVEKNGTTNVPVPPRPTSTNKPLREALFELHIRRLLLSDGWILYNDTKTPITVHGGDLLLALDGGGTPDHPLYLGNLVWQTMQFTSKPYVPLQVGLSAKFTLRRDGFTLEQGALSAGRSHLDAQVEMNNFSNPQWSFRYRGWVDLLDFRETCANPRCDGAVDVRGEGQFARGSTRGAGVIPDRISFYRIWSFMRPASLAAAAINRQPWPRGAGFFAGAFGGRVTGRVTMRFPGLQFRADTHVQDVRLALFCQLSSIATSDRRTALGRTDDRGHDGNLERPFQHFEISAKTVWETPEKLTEHHQPVSAAGSSAIATIPTS